MKKHVNKYACFNHWVIFNSQENAISGAILVFLLKFNSDMVAVFGYIVIYVYY